MTIEDVRDRIPERWGKWISCSEGWHQTISDLNDKIAALDPNYTIAQVKEKFGELRFYIDTIDPACYEQAQLLVREAERVVSVICEQCGEPGVIRTDLGWMRTLCDGDYAKVKVNPRIFHTTS